MKLLDKELLTEAKESILRFPVPGLTTAAIKSGKIVESCALGTADGHAKPMTEDTLFEAASLTKSLFATLFLRLCDRKIVFLDEPLSAQTSLRWSEDERWGKITPRMALCHGTGLPNWACQPMSLRFTPGTSYSYSGEGYYFLQHLVEEKTGLTMPELMQREFFTPWGMDTNAVWSPAIGRRMSLGFGTENEIIKHRDAPDLEGNAPEPNAAWSLYANARLYASFLCHMINEHGNLSDKSFADMTKRQNSAGGQIDWGLGWGIPSQEPTVLWHWGDNSGFKSFAVWDRESGDGLTIFTNSDLGVHCYMDLCERMTDARFLPAIENFIAHAE